MLRFARRYPLPVVYIAMFCAVSSVYVWMLQPAGQRALVDNAATNLNNLGSDPVGTMVMSAFVAEAAPWMWVAFAVVGLFPVAHRFGNLRALFLIATAQIVGTLVSEGVVAWQIAAGQVPLSQRLLPDVGPSYVIASALIATILYGSEHPAVRGGVFAGPWWRLGAFLGLAVLAPHLFNGIGHLDVAAVGHTVALITGALIGAIFTRTRRVRQPVLD